MVLVNGSESQSLPVADRGLAYGDGVFRTLRVSHGAPLQWPRHYRKLAADCAALDLSCPVQDLFEADIAGLLHATSDAILKLIVTRGAGERGYRYERGRPANRIVMATPYRPPPESFVRDGVCVHRCSLRLAHQPALAGVKHLNRLENVLARAEWNDARIPEGILCDFDDRVIGGTMTNLFAVFGDELATPALARCGVAGVTRERVIEAARGGGLACVVRDIGWAELVTADEVFLVNSLAGVWPVKRIERRTWTPGPIARRAQGWVEQGA